MVAISTAPAILNRLRASEVRDIFVRNNIRQIYLTGSFARGEETRTSDVDLIYVKRPGSKFTLLNIGDIKYSLEEKLGKEVDLISENAIRPEIRMNILKDKIAVF